MGIEVVNGIVLGVQRYGEQGMVVQLYSREYGRRGVISYAGKAQDGARLSSYFKPTSILRIRVRQGRHAGNMPRLLGVEDWVRQTLEPAGYEHVAGAAFIGELLQRILIEPSPNEELYEFLVKRIALFATATTDVLAFLMVFLLDLSEVLGYEPHGHFSASTPSFNLVSGVFCSERTSEPANTISEGDAEVWSNMLTRRYQADMMGVVSAQRYRILQQELRYIEIHSGLRLPLKSFAVLRELIG